MGTEERLVNQLHDLVCSGLLNPWRAVSQGQFLPSSVHACSQHSFEKWAFVPRQSSGCEVEVFNRMWLCVSMDSSLPGSSVHEIVQAQVLGWVAISFSKWVWQSGKKETRVLSLALPPVASRILFKCLLHFVPFLTCKTELKQYMFKIYLLWMHLEEKIMQFAKGL